MYVYRIVLPPAGPGVAHRLLTVAVHSDGPYWLSPSGTPGDAERLDGDATRAFLPTANSLLAVLPGAEVSLTLVPYDKADHVAGEIVEYLFTADDSLPDPDPDDLGVLFLREED